MVSLSLYFAKNIDLMVFYNKMIYNTMLNSFSFMNNLSIPQKVLCSGERFFKELFKN